MINSTNLQIEYNNLLATADKYFNEKDFESSVISIEAAARIAYEYSFIKSFCDDNLEKLLYNISTSTIDINKNNSNSNESKIVFYDYFGIDNRGLTEQYISSLIKLNYDILYIIPNDLYFGESKRIVEIIKRQQNCEYFIFSELTPRIERAKKICELISIFKPSKAFLHFAPWDTIGVLIFSRYKNILKRYFINLTDHAFWIGKSTIDICIEFRSFGASLSQKLRSIPEEKIKYLPYFPIVKSQNNSPSLKLVNELNGKFIGVTGGNGYKFLDKELSFYHLIKKIFVENKSFVLLMIGTGKAGEIIQKAAINDGFIDRIFLINDTPDLYNILRNCHLYIGSYPIMGALMTQLAVLAGLPILAYTEKKYEFNYVEELIPYLNLKFKTFNSKEEFLQIASKIINDENYRTYYINLTKDSVISEHEFILRLEKILEGDGESTYIFDKYDVNGDLSEKMSELYIDVENEYFKRYKIILNSIITKLPEQFKSTIFNNTDSSQISNKVSIKKIIKRKTKKIIKHVIKYALKIAEIEIKEKKSNLPPPIFKQLGENSSIYSDSRIINPNYIKIGSNFNTLYHLRLEAIDNYAGLRYYPEIIIGDNVSLNTDNHIGCIDKVIIGNNVLSASKVFITDHYHGDTEGKFNNLPPNMRPLISKGPVIIEDNVWIGEGVSIMPGVTIGENSIIGANSVVTKNVMPNTIVAGIPTKTIKTL